MLNSKFEQLPNEILLKIFFDRSISAEDLFSLSNVCKRFQNVCHSEKKFWKSMVEKRWPSVSKNLDLWNIKISQVENWKKEIEDSLKIRKKLEEILNNLIYQMYNLEKLPWPTLTSIYETVNVGNFGDLIALSHIERIIKEAREKGDLPNLFYSRIILYHLNYHIFSQEMKYFLQLPPERKTFEKGVYYLSKAFQPEAFFSYEYEEVSLKLDKLAHVVQSYLRTINPNHPAISIELFSPEEPLENSKWSDEETHELFASINHVMCIEHAIRKFTLVCKFFLQKVENGDEINNCYFTVIYIAVCHRLGIPLEPIKFGYMLLYKWKNLRFEYSDIADPHNYLNSIDLREQWRFLLSVSECCSIENILMDIAYCSFLDIERARNNDFFLDREVAAGMILQIQFFPEDEYMWTYENIIKFSLENEVYLEAVIETCRKIPSFLSCEDDDYLQKIRDFSAHAERLLTTEEKEPKVIIPKNRKKSDNLRFATGMIVSQMFHSQPGVIIGWDKIYDSVNDLKHNRRIGLHELDKNKPFYITLFSNGSTFYSTQEELYLREPPIPITSHKVGKYFRRFNGKFYVPNEALRSEYPEDESAIKSLYIRKRKKFFRFNT